jgi:hypothetical protein
MRAFLVVLGVLILGGVALGFYQGWFHLTVNKEKMKEDTEGAKEKLQGLGKKTEEKADKTVDNAKEQPGTTSSGPKTATGRVKKVEAADNRFLMTTADNKELAVYTDPSSRLRLNDKEVKLEHVRLEDEVEVAYDLKDGKNLATSVTVNRHEAP